VKVYLSVAAVAILFLALASPAVSQSNVEPNQYLQINLQNPGARSLGMGGAFAGRADDATAAYANPAGLIWLTRPEISLEGRSSDFRTQYPNGGRFNGAPSGMGIDTNPNLVLGESESTTEGLSFASYVHPLSDRWRIAVFRHKTLDFEGAVSQSQGAFFDQANGADDRVPVTDASMELKVIDIGLSVAYEASDNLSFGLTINRYDFEMNSIAERFRFRDPNDLTNIYSGFDFVGDAGMSSTGTSNTVGNDDDIALSGGILWKTADSKWSVGLVYRGAPEFDFSGSFYARPQTAAPCGQFSQPPSVPCGELQTGVNDNSLTGTGTYQLPDVISVGASVQPNDSWTIGLEIARVGYSNLEPTLNQLVALDADLGTDLGDFKIDDGTEVRLGFEYVIAGSTDIALRLGGWLDPDHQMRWEDPGTTQSPSTVGNLGARYRPGDDEYHITAGIGFTFDRFQVDAAYDDSEYVSVASLSGVFRF
jgi:long-subunit fatty acid transport protein